MSEAGESATSMTRPTFASRWVTRLRALQGPFDPTPFLGALAAICAFGDLTVNRVLVRVLAGEHRVLIAVSRSGDLLRNLAAVAGLIALSIALFRFVLDAGAIRLWRRLTVSALAGVFVPITALALFIRAEGTFQPIGPIAAASGLVLTVQLSMAGARLPAPAGIRLGTLLVAFSAFSGFVTLLALIATPKIGATAVGNLLLRILSGAGETAFLVAPIAVGATLWSSPGVVRRDRIIAAGVLLGAFALITTGQLALDRTFAVLLVGAQDVGAFLESSPGLYVLAYPIALGAIAFGLVHKHPANRQAALAVLLVVSAGFSPRTPSRALMLVLGAALLTRAAIALAIHRRARAGASATSGGRERSISTSTSPPASSDTA